MLFLHLLLAAWGAAGETCPSLERLELGSQLCFDSSPAFYYQARSPNNNNNNNRVLIWLGEGVDCAVGDVGCCEAQSLFCSSKAYPSQLTAETLFCHSANAGGDTMRKAFVPSCNADGFVSSLPGVLRELQAVFGMNASTQLVLGGTGNAGAGIVQHFKWIVDSFPLVKFVFDSFLDVSSDGKQFRSVFPSPIPVLFLQSEYDFAQLYKVMGDGLGNQTELESFLAIETFGEQMRQVLHNLKLFPNLQVSVVSRACGTFGYVLPTKFHSYTKSLVGSGVNITVTRSALPFRDIQHLVWGFIQGTHSPIAVQDTCRAFLCRVDCPESVQYAAAIANPDSAGFTAVVLSNLMGMVLAWFAVFACLWRTGELNYQATRPPQVETALDSGEFDSLMALFDLQLTALPELCVQVCHITYFAKPNSQPILTNVSAEFQAGQLHAIVGVSGGGKTTLLELLARSRTSGVCVGEFHCFDKATKLEHNHYSIGLVKQQDMFLEELTVSEHLRYLSCLKNGSNAAAQNQASLVQDQFDFMDQLGECKISQLSGGERKRLSIASQFVCLPRILLLDEPTSGLDANQAFKMVKTFKLCCEMHRMCVVVTLHQARQEIFSLVDTLTVLIGGEMVITGRRPNETFGMLGLGQHVNLGDELLDAMTRLPHLRFENPDLTLVLPSAIPTGQLEKGNDIVEQASLLLSRTIHRGGLDLQTTAGKMALVGGTVICVVCYRDPDAEVLSFERAITLDYILLCGIVFLQGVFVGDRYWRERFAFDFEVSAGVKIHPQSFALSLLARFTVASIVETLCFAVMPIYLLFPWDGTLPQRVAVLVLCGLCTSFQYLVVEILFTKPHDKQTAAHINIAVLALSFLLNGFVISLSDLPVYLSWVPLVVASFWSFSALLTMDLFGKQLDCTRTDVSKLYCLFSGSSGDSVLHALEFDRFTVSESVLALTAIWLAWMALAGLALDRSRGDQRVWVLEDEKEEPILGSKSLRLVGLFVIDLATVLLGVSTGGGGITLVACLAYIALSCHVTWHLAHDSVAVWLTVPIDLILLLLQSHRALLVGAIVVQRANRMARLVMLSYYGSFGNIAHVRVEQEQEEEMTLIG